MKKIKSFLLILSFILLPTIVFANSSGSSEAFPIGIAIRN